MQTLIITHSPEQQRRFQHDYPQKVTVSMNEALAVLRQQHYAIVVVDLSEQESAGCALLEALLVAELAGEIAPIPQLLACRADSQQLMENRLQISGFDQLVSLPLADEQQYASSFREQPDLQELYALAGQQQPIIAAMIPTLLQTLTSDIQQLDSLKRTGTLAQIADLAHRMKSSFHLLGMRYARRSCIAMERLPALIEDCRVSEAQGNVMCHRFYGLVHENYHILQGALLRYIG